MMTAISAYAVSKMGVLAYTSVLARHARNDLKYFVCCPGWCRTDMAGMAATYSAGELFKMGRLKRTECLSNNRNRHCRGGIGYACLFGLDQ